MLVHFICRGNVFRSFFAEAYLKSLKLPNVTVISSGTVADLYRESNQGYFKKHTGILESHGIGAYAKMIPEQLDQSRMEDNDVIILMNDIVYSEATAIVTLPTHTIVWNIIDIGEGNRTQTIENGREVEEVVYDEITAKVDELVKELALN